MILVQQIRVSIQDEPDQAIGKAVEMLKLRENDWTEAHLHKVSVDGRRGKIAFVCSVLLSLNSAGQEESLAAKHVNVQLLSQREERVVPGKEALGGPVVICGLGPAGLFAALELSNYGYKTIVLERGGNMEARQKAVSLFEETGQLDSECNIQFGEGGAGTFSDGKLTTRIKDPLCTHVINSFVEAGAPKEIAYEAKPHIGTDYLRVVFVNMRKVLQNRGVEVHFGTKLTEIVSSGKNVLQLKTNQDALSGGALVLATGHSARDTYRFLQQDQYTMVAKPFSVGMRIEHLQSEIDKGLYHEAAGHPALPPGEYQLSTRAGGRGVYTFCMCPGGSVVAAASEQGGVVTNGMSLHRRNGRNANAAVVAGVLPEDFGGDPFKALAYQEDLEKSAYMAGGGGYRAPAQTLGSFMQGTGRLELGRVQPSYTRGVQAYDLGSLLTKQLAEPLRQGLDTFGRKLPGFTAPDAVLTGLETRTSAPLRVVRGETLESVSHPLVYPCGEGAGYAGGIMSAAVDGIRVARQIISRYSNKT